MHLTVKIVCIRCVKTNKKLQDSFSNTKNCSAKPYINIHLKIWYESMNVLTLIRQCLHKHLHKFKTTNNQTHIMHRMNKMLSECICEFLHHSYMTYT